MGVIILEAPWDSGSGGVEAGEATGSSNALLA